jgi:hypothetical protein
MCSNSSIESTRSNWAASGVSANVYVAMSPVTMSTFVSPFCRARASMCSFCVRELEKPVMWELGKISAR